MIDSHLAVALLPFITQPDPSHNYAHGIIVTYEELEGLQIGRAALPNCGEAGL